MASFVSKYRRSSFGNRPRSEKSKYRVRDASFSGGGSPIKVTGQQGNAALARLKSQIAKFPMSLAHDVAKRASPELTRLTATAFSSGRNVYGESREAKYPSATGKPLTLYKSGDTSRTLRFATSGTIVRCVLAKPYMKYLIGKYGVLPNGHMPVSWARELDVIVDTSRVSL
jgi:hypothetical protein